jgi:hypothetical protein
MAEKFSDSVCNAQWYRACFTGLRRSSQPHQQTPRSMRRSLCRQHLCGHESPQAARVASQHYEQVGRASVGECRLGRAQAMTFATLQNSRLAFTSLASIMDRLASYFVAIWRTCCKCLRAEGQGQCVSALSSTIPPTTAMSAISMSTATNSIRLSFPHSGKPLHNRELPFLE